MIFTATTHGLVLPTSVSTVRDRRGVLLLIVISMLTLFLMLGTTFIVVTSRARATARAFSRAGIAQESVRGAAGRRLVDNAFRILARGTTDVACQEPSLRNGNDLLGDKYGLTLPGAGVGGAYGRISGVLPLLGGLLELTLESPITAHPALANGRIVTLTLPGICSSRRILAAKGSLTQITQLVISGVSPVDGTEITREDIQRGLAASGPHLVINGREFSGDIFAGDSNEPFDGFMNADGSGDTDPYLAAVVPTTPFDPYSPPTDMAVPEGFDVRRMSFFGKPDLGASPPVLAEVDNDQDGVLDSKWIDVGFPVMRADDGTTFRAQAAYLVLDLDSRLNLNVHGSEFLQDAMLASAEVASGAPPSSLQWPDSSLDLGPDEFPQDPLLPEKGLPAGLDNQQFNELPCGSGYGPAEVRLWDLFLARPGYLPDEPSELDPGSKTGFAGDMFRGIAYGFAGKRNIVRNPSAGAPTQKRPNASYSEGAGRYGFSSAGSPDLPGLVASNDPISRIQDEGRYPAINPNNIPPAGQFIPLMANEWGATPSVGIDDQYATPSDLKGRMKIVADSRPNGDGLVSQMWYIKPGGKWEDDCVDDPYEMRLSSKPSSHDAPFLVDELARVLRVYDWDATQIPTRLWELLGGDTERLRLLLTTDSWDTTAIVGDTWKTIEDTILAKGIDPADLPYLLGPELMTGRRLDLNRQVASFDPLMASDLKEGLCRNLYMLLWLLEGGPSDPDECKGMAQWAVNVVDFRDADSTMSTFFYDDNPADGWDAVPGSSPYVIGAERPEILITEALCWKNDDGDEGGVHIVLHHPWAAKALDGNTLIASRDPDAVAPELATFNDSGDYLNEVNLRRLGFDSNGTPYDPSDDTPDDNSPVWRLRLGTSATAPIIRFDQVGPDANIGGATLYSSDYQDPNQDQFAWTMRPDSWLCITGNRGTSPGQNPQIAAGIPQLVINLTDGSPAGPLPPEMAGATDQVILLERLANPLLAHEPDPSLPAFNPYIEVDRIEVPVANRTPVAPLNHPQQYFAKQTRPVTGPPAVRFWQQPTPWVPKTLTTVSAPFDSTQDEYLDTISPPGGTRVAWFPWLNRPLLSPVELLMAPSSLVDFDPSVPPATRHYRSQLLSDYAGFSGNGWLDAIAPKIGTISSQDLLRHLLQATTVPTRFSGLATSVADPRVYTGKGTGLEWLVINHINSWREPGRVNLNTVTDDRVWDAVARRGPRPTSETSSTGDGFDRSEAGLSIQTDDTVDPDPAKSLLDLYGLDPSASTVFNDPSTIPGQSPADNPQFAYQTANRLANVATNRSNVFAVWVTIGFFECYPNGTFVTDSAGLPKQLGSDTGEVDIHRGFYIFDRSIPVGYVTGRDLNLEDAIRLRRIIQ